MQQQLEELRPSLKLATSFLFGICFTGSCCRVETMPESAWLSISASTSLKLPPGIKIINRITLGKEVVEVRTIIMDLGPLPEKIILTGTEAEAKMARVKITLEEPITISTNEESPPTSQ